MEKYFGIPINPVARMAVLLLAIISISHMVDAKSPAEHKLVAPSEATLKVLEQQYKWAQEEIRNNKLGAHVFSEFKYSIDEMLNFGLWYMSEAKTPPDFERAAWFIIGAYEKPPEYTMLKGEKIPSNVLVGKPLNHGIKFAAKLGIVAIKSDSRLTEELRLHAGNAAAIAGNYYANKMNSAFDLQRAYKLHLAAGRAGIQESYLSAGYILQTKEMKDSFVKGNGVYRPSYRAAVFQHFSFAEQLCSAAYMQRKFYPSLKENCMEAKQQAEATNHVKSNLCENRLKPSYKNQSVFNDYIKQRNSHCDKKNGSETTTIQTGMNLLMGVLVAAVVADILNPSQTKLTTNEEWQKKQRERAKQQMDRTWFNVDAAMSVP